MNPNSLVYIGAGNAARKLRKRKKLLTKLTTLTVILAPAHIHIVPFFPNALDIKKLIFLMLMYMAFCAFFKEPKLQLSRCLVLQCLISYFAPIILIIR